MYLGGMSSSLPEDVQYAMYRTVPGLENVKIVRDVYKRQLQEGAAAKLVQFATDNNIPLTGMTTIGDLTGVTGEALANKMVDILYKLNPAQWTELGNAFPDAANVIAANSAVIEGMNSFFGINLATNPFNGSWVPSIAWLIPILAGPVSYTHLDVYKRQIHSLYPGYPQKNVHNY